MKYLLCLLFLTASYQAQARCNGHYADSILKELFGKEIDLSGISDASSEVGDICMTGCKYSEGSAKVQCDVRYAQVVKKYLPQIEAKAGLKADSKILEGYLYPKVAASSIPGCHQIGDYERSVVNPCKLANCGNIRKAVLCSTSAMCEPGSLPEVKADALATQMDFTCVADGDDNCPSLKKCYEDEEFIKFEGLPVEKRLAPQKAGATKQ
jgi:hypothetical protein